MSVAPIHLVDVNSATPLSVIGAVPWEGRDLPVIARYRLQHKVYVLCKHPDSPWSNLVFEEVGERYSAVTADKDLFLVLMRVFNSRREVA